ncbi:MAG: Omp28 family outer membrane lipoprotein [Paramuribaculum sp.]|nr:Omp28 family outer membrane lipoprotein [Paramuribaculum sp.]MDE6304701.1 Omp28 family outer membrane lipoprotein [Paramuribaculum sp.]
MKNRNLILGLWVAASAVLAGCDTVDMDDRFIAMEPVVDTSSRTVLLEEFTGQLCSNCPDAHKIASQLSQQYGDKFIVVSIHGGGFGMSEEYTSFNDNFVGLATQEGMNYHTSLGVSSWPAGVINRNSGILTSDAWSAAVRKSFETPAELGILANASVSNGNIEVEVTLVPSTDIASPNLNVWVTESHIDAFQQDGAQYLPSYEHNHVFRKSATPMPDGMTIESLKSGQHAGPYKFTIPVVDNDHVKWNVSNLSVVVFVDTKSGGVLQATHTAVNENQDSEQ